MTIQIAFPCSHCEREQRVAIDRLPFDCPDCRHTYGGDADSTSLCRIEQCLICGCHELFVRKDFSQRLGIAIVATGFVLSSIAWGFHRIYMTYGILFLTALIDVILYVTVGNLLQCYRCTATYRGLEESETHSPFSLETHERFRQQAARLQ